MIEQTRVAAIFILALSLLAAPRLAPAAETKERVVELKGGQSVVGPVLKEGDDAVYIDLGFDVLRLPRSYVARIGGEREAAAPSVAPGAGLLTGGESLPYQKIVAPADKLARQELIELLKKAVVIVSNSQGLGSGFFIDNEGHIITNYHVVKGDKYQKVTLLKGGENDSKKRIDEVEVKAYSPMLDIALLQIKAEDLKDLDFRPLPVYRGLSLRESEPVYAVGNPGMGGTILEHSVTNGIISSPNRNFNDVLYIQTTAAINPGNSGGPLVNARGEVVGLVTLKAIFQEGIAFALQPSYIHHFLLNEQAYSFGKNNPNSGYRYLDPPQDYVEGGDEKEGKKEN